MKTAKEDKKEINGRYCSGGCRKNWMVENVRVLYRMLTWCCVTLKKKKPL